MKLLIRNRNGIRLTADGEKMLPFIKNAALALEELQNSADAARGLKAETIRVGAFTSVAVHWLPGIIKDFEKAFPNIKFGLMNGDYHDIREWLAAESIDVGFVTLPSDVPDCEYIPLIKDRLLAVLPKDHRLADSDCFPVDELKGEPFISLLEQSDHDVRRALEPAGMKPNIKFTTKDDYAIIAMVEQGLGISIMPELLLLGNDSSVKVLPLKPDVARTIGLAVPLSLKNNPNIPRFCECVKKWLAEKYGENAHSL